MKDKKQALANNLNSKESKINNSKNTEVTLFDKKSSFIIYEYRY